MSKSNLPFKVSKQILATLKKLKFSSIPYKVAFGLERVVQSKGYYRVSPKKLCFYIQLEGEGKWARCAGFSFGPKA